MFHQPVFRILTALIICATLSLATHCYEDLDFPDWVPFPSDCRYIVAHMPWFRTPTAPGNTGPIVNPSTPFFPNAAFYHRSCGIQIELHNLPWQEWQKDEWQDESLLKVTERNALEGWAMVRSDAVKIITECIDAHQTGWSFGEMSLAEPAGLFYTVIVTRFSFFEDPRDTQRRILNFRDPLRSHESLFDMTYYNV